MDKNKYYCKINGRIYNLKKIQDILDGKSNNDITVAMINEYNLEPLDAMTFEEVIKFNNNKIPTDYNECLEKFRKRNQLRHSNTPKCPTCQSTNIRKISTASKAANTALFGIFGNKRKMKFHCNNCGYEW